MGSARLAQLLSQSLHPFQIGSNLLLQFAINLIVLDLGLIRSTCLSAQPLVQFSGVCENRRTRSLSNAMDGKPQFHLPSLRSTNSSPEVNRNFLPGIESWCSRGLALCAVSIHGWNEAADMVSTSE